MLRMDLCHRSAPPNVTFVVRWRAPANRRGCHDGNQTPRALAALDKPAPILPNKPLRITDKVRRAINLFVAGNCKQITEAAEKVGLARESLGRALDRPRVLA
jgi:hypothetical protein